MNEVKISGRLGKDPELRYIGSGTALCTFNIAVSEDYQDKKSGNWVKRPPSWISVKAWGQTAELCGENLSKGKEVELTGKLHEEKWTDKDSNQRSRVGVVAFEVKEVGGTPKPKESKEPDDDLPF